MAHFREAHFFVEKISVFPKSFKYDQKSGTVQLGHIHNYQILVNEYIELQRKWHFIANTFRIFICAAVHFGQSKISTNQKKLLTLLIQTFEIIIFQ